MVRLGDSPYPIINHTARHLVDTTLGARIRVDLPEEGLEFSHDAKSLGAMEMLNLTCPAGDFDLVFTPAAAPGGYEDLEPASVMIGIGEQTARAASVADVLRSKEEAGRDKDIRSLPLLRRFVREHTSD